MLSNRFRVTVYRARAALGAKEVLLEEHNRYRLSMEVLAASDLWTFNAGLEQIRRDPLPGARLITLEHLLRTHQGEYLPSESPEWAQQAREEHRTVYAQAQVELSDLQCHAGTCASSVETLALALRDDPFMGENQHQRLMTCLSVVQGKYAATEHYRRFVAFLRREVNDVPMPETLHLAARVKSGEHICRRQTHQADLPNAHHCSCIAEHPCPVVAKTVIATIGHGTCLPLH